MIKLWEMLTSALRALVKNPVKESFFGKRKKKTFNVLTDFFISHKSDGLLTSALRALVIAYRVF